MTEQELTQLPDFVLTDEAGNRRQLGDLTGEKGLLLVFVRGTWCPQCVQTFYFVARYANRLTKQGVNVAFVAVDETGPLRTFKKSASLPMPFPLLADPDEQVRSQIGITHSETYLLVNPHGEICQRFFDPDGQHRPGSQAILEAVQQHLSPSLFKQ